MANRGRHKSRRVGLSPLFFILGIVAAIGFLRDSVLADYGGLAMTSSSYGSDSSTILFDDFEGSTRAESRSLTATFDAGYRTGQGLHLTETNSYAYFGDSSWIGPGAGPDTDNNLFHAGTIEFYYKPDTTLSGVSRSFLISHNRQKPNQLTYGKFALSIVGGSTLDWSVGTGGTFVSAIDYATSLNAGQWYHIAVTWDTTTGVRLMVNGSLLVSDPTQVPVDSAPFTLGGSQDPTLPTPVGTFDKLRISSRVRTETELPTALEILDLAPGGAFYGETTYQPFTVSFRSRASDSPTITVKLLLSPDSKGFSGTTIRTGLAASDTVSLSGLPAGVYRLVAIAQTSTETAFAASDFLSIRADTSITSVTQSADKGTCVLTRMGLDSPITRSVRDIILGSRIGRWLTAGYYTL